MQTTNPAQVVASWVVRVVADCGGAHLVDRSSFVPINGNLGPVVLVALPDADSAATVAQAFDARWSVEFRDEQRLTVKWVGEAK